MKRATLFLFFACLIALPRLSPAQSTEADLTARLVRKPLFLRGLWRNDKLKFDGDGRPLGKAVVGSFTVAGVEVEKVTLRSNGLDLEGSRAALRFTDGLPERVVMPDHAGSQKAEKVRIEVQAPADGDYRKALDTIFAEKLEDLVPALPDYWQPYAQEHLIHPIAAVDYRPEDVETPGTMQGQRDSMKKSLLTNPGLVKIGGAVKPPVPIRMPDPRFTQEARQAGVNGTVLVYLWVDASGKPTHIHIVQPCGMGLDEAAVEAVSHYAFKPATRGGMPVTVEMKVEVNFQIF